MTESPKKPPKVDLVKIKRRLGDIPFESLLPESIKFDPTVKAATQALDDLLRRTTLAIPKLLIWGRLDRERPQLTPPLARLAEAGGGLKALNSEALEILAWQLHVDFREVAKTDAELEAMVRSSIPWHRLKGTPAAVEEALALFGVWATCDESGSGLNWAVYELELLGAPTREQVGTIVRVASEAAPKRCWLRRIHDEYDFRPIIVGVGPILGDGYLSDDSGIWNEDEGIKESFGHKTSLASASFWGKSGAAHTRGDLYPGRIPYLDKFILGLSRLGELYPRNHGAIIGQWVALLGAGLDGNSQTYWWTGPWDSRQWGHLAAKTPVRRIHHRLEVSLGQLVLGVGRLSWATERTDRLQAVLVENPIRLGSYILGSGEAGQGIRRFHLNEYFLTTTATQSPQLMPKAQAILGGSLGRASSAPRNEAPLGLNISYQYSIIHGLTASRPGTTWLGPWQGTWGLKAFIDYKQGE